MEILKIDEIYELLKNKLLGWWETLILMLPNIVVAVLVIIFFVVLAKSSNKLITKIVAKITDKKALNDLLAKTVFIAIIGVGLFLALGILKLDKTITSLLAGAGIIGLALSFAFQDTATNFMAGIFLIVRKPLHVGDIVKSNDEMGVVHEVNLRNTILQSFQGQLVFIPNKNVFQNTLTNFSSLHKRRIDLEIGVSYRDNLTKAKDVAIKAIESLDFISKNDEVSVFYNEFGNSSINFTLMFWIDYPDQPGFLKARSEAIIAVKKAFDENQITIPFPIRTLEFLGNGHDQNSNINSIRNKISKIKQHE